MNRKKGFPKLFKKLGIYAFWLLVWQLLAVFFHNDILLVSPEKTLRTFFSCLITAGFWRSIWFSISRICIGFFLAMLLGILTGALSCRFRIVGEFLEPPIQFMKSIPVASFVILALIWTGSKNLSILISFLVAYPILHINTVSGLKSTDPKLLEMAQVFRVPFHKKVFYLYRPALSPYLISACKSALGMAFKSGIAAEVIGVPDFSIGANLYEAKIYLDTASLFAWTLAIILIASCFEKILLRLMTAAGGKGNTVHEKQ